MGAEDGEEFVQLMNDAIARVAEHASDDRDCALLLGRLRAVKQRLEEEAHRRQAARRAGRR